MAANLKVFVKVCLSYLFNGLKLLRMSRVGKGCAIGRGLTVHSPEGIRLGNNVRIGRFGRLSCYRNQNGEMGVIEISDNCYIGDQFSALSASTLTIENNVLIAGHVAVIAENHGVDPEADVPYGLQPLQGKPVRIGAFSWIGEKVVVLPGVDIGKWCIVGAGSIVTKSVPDYCMVVGNPARVIRKYDLETHQWVPAH